MYTIEKGIEVPSSQKRKKSCYPFSKMEIGDSFFIPLDENFKFTYQLQGSVYNDSLKYRNRGHAGFKVKTRSLENGIRVWRVS